MQPPATIETVEQLEDLLSTPTPGVIEAVNRLEGDILVLGAGGKMGLTLARMADRAAKSGGRSRRIIAASRFSTPGLAERFQTAGIEPVVCDFHQEEDVNRLPDVPNVVYMVGTKFGTSSQQHTTWAVNSFLPGVMCLKYRHSRIVAFGTGNVYPLVPATSKGCNESQPLKPVGEYGMSAVGRERMFQYFSWEHNIPIALIRLNYACELRYGVLVDIAWKVLKEEPVDLRMGYFNTIWQGDANAMALQAFSRAATPMFDVNVTGLETLSVRTVAIRLGGLMNREPVFSGTEETTALLSDARLAHEIFDAPRISTGQMVEWVAHWVMSGGASHGRPTHFETRDGNF